MEKKATIYEVARQVGVSTATVSRVLNDSPNVSEDTKKKVQKVIKELNFSPQVTARKLARGKPQMMAIIVPSFTTPYYNEVLKGIKDEMRRVDLDIVMYNTGSKNPEKDIINFFDRGMADAFLIISIEINEEVSQRLKASNVPVVLVNSVHDNYHSFGMNDYRGGFLAGEHLINQGFESIGLIDSTLEMPASRERKKGFTDALKEHGIDINETFFVRGESEKHAGYTEEAGFEAIAKLEKTGAFPRAIFCLNDTLAVGAMYALSRMGKKVPEDIAIMGYDNIKLSKYLELTTVDQKMHTIGARAIERMQDLLDDGSIAPRKDIIDPILVSRGSTDRR